MKTRLFLIRTMTLALGLFAALTYQPSTGFAQGTAFTYQGRLDTSGSPANGSYDLTFEVHDTPSEIAPVGPLLTNAAVSVSNGLFTTTLDFGLGVFTGSPRWLEIGVRTNGGGAFSTLMPRQRLTPTPYAIYSATATTAATASMAATVTGPVAASQLTGTISSNNIAAGTITGAMLAAGSVGSNQLAAGAVTTSALAEGAVTATKIHSSLKLLSTLAITNPTPFALDQFGFAVAAVGADKILVGANLDDVGSNNAGAAHLFDTTGNLLVTFTNPTPAADDRFGYSVCAVGVDKLLVGAYQDDTGALNAGSAYLFNTSGGLLLTITNPSPSVADVFGLSVAAVGTEHILIGAPNDNSGGGQVGAVYLYNLAGQLVQSITNPTPASLDSFGSSIAAVGLDKVLIGAASDDFGAMNSGTAYLFSTNGTLLTTFTNPTPFLGDFFGDIVIPVGLDRVLISATSDNTGATDAGAAYLYDLNGNLLATFTNPTPAALDGFGEAMTAVGTDKVLIGADTDDTGAANAGTAYLFDLSGALLLTLTNPAPSTSDRFAVALAALDEHRLIIGAMQDDLGSNDAGGVYLLAVDTFTPGLVAESVRVGAVDAGSLAAGAVTTSALAVNAVHAINIAPGVITAVQLAKPPQSGSLASAALVEDFGAADFAVVFNPAFNSPPNVTLSLQSTNDTGDQVTAVFVKSESKTNFTGRLLRQNYPRVIDRSGDVGSYASLTEVSGNPAISYFDASDSDLKYVRANDNTGNSWSPPVTVSSAGSVGKFTSLVVVGGNPAISYHDYFSDELHYVRANNSIGSAWGSPVLAAGGGLLDAGRHASMAIVNGNPAISYAAGYSGFVDLKYVRATNTTGTGWSSPVIVQSAGSSGEYSSLAVVLGNPAIAYLAETNTVLRFIRALDANGVSWGTPITVDASGTIGGHISLAIIDGKAAISYYDSANGDLKYVRATDTSGSVWDAPIVLDAAGDVGQFTSLKTINGLPAVSYYDVERRALKYIQAKDAAGTDWKSPVSIEIGTVGGYTSLASVNLEPAIAYYDQASGVLKFIRQTGGFPYTINWIAIEP